MKLTTFFSLIMSCGIWANSLSQSTKISLNLQNASVSEFIASVEEKTDFYFIYQDDIFDENQQVSIKADKLSLDAILSEFAKQTSVVVKTIDYQIVVANSNKEVTEIIEQRKAVQQEVEITGTISDTGGSTLPGASIVEKGTTNGTQSDFDGNFSLKVESTDAVLVISYLGFLTQEVPVNGQNNITISLKEDAAALDEVVVVGFGERSTKKVTAAISQISAEELGIEERPVTNIQSALIGSLPGLRGFNNNGRPGATPTLSIRGVSTIFDPNNPPTILTIIDDFEGSLSDINPQDIESVTILKDAAAVAVYGARGANGVLLVTTKRTRRDESISVSYNFTGSVQAPSPLPETLTASELIAFENFAVTGDPTGGGNPSAPYSQTAIDLANNGFYPETQWPDELYNSSSGQQSHNLTIQGGSEKIGFLMTAGHLEQNGLVIGGDNFKRLNLRLKIDADITDWLTIGTNTVITNRITNVTPAQGGNGLLGSPFFPVQTDDGFFVDKGSPGEANPIAQANSGSFDKTITDAINVQLYGKIKLFEGLTIEERVSFVKGNINRRQFTNVYDFVRLNLEDPDSYTNPDSPNRDFVPGIPDARSLVLTSETSYKVTALTRLNYDATFGDHTISALLGFQAIQGQAEAFRTGRQGFFLDDPMDLTLGQAATPVSLFGSNGTDALGNTSRRDGNETTLSYFGRLVYDYKNRYVAELAFRYDGSSNFLESNQWGFFPSASLAWNIDEEPFMKTVDFVDRLKLRGSYGISGDDSGIARSVVQFANVDVTGYPFGGEIQPAINLGDPASRDLQWETATIFNVGLDFSLWQDKFQLNSEYFINNRDNILDFAITPTEFGLGDVPANLYAVKSWGWEFELGHRNNIGNDFSYWFNGNITYYDNEITDLAGRESPDLAVGQSVTQRLGWETDGFFDSQNEIDAYLQGDGATPIDQGGVGGTAIGGYKFVDQLTIDSNGDGIPDEGDGVIDADDRIVLERNNDANLNLGVNLGAKYKGLALSARFYGALERTQWFSGADAHEPFLNGTNAFVYQTNYWRQDNPNAFFPVPQGNGIQGYNSSVSHLIFNNKFIKLQNVTLSYDFDESILKSLKYLSALSITFSVENIGTVWTDSPIRDSGWDPELGAGTVDYPLPLTTSLGLNVRF